MPDKIAKGWFKGLAAGAENSGTFLGTIVPIAAFVVMLTLVIGAIIGVRACIHGKEPPKPCSDYSYKMGIIGESKAQCTRWPAMEMRLEKRWLKADIVHCKCTTESRSASHE